mmetsp:Transcript_7805/g.20776  ORF Transcript_7805/g.20776 Transcript_7805/m.20776 type:complete len:318 (+) Transcript_7805:40-993(+)|eukprot:CAMPEP_0202362286 /NCGR_PEP_ID=MMETSP1126-20121109/14511_1 /ASSEMBLY_ACC=CAM_ASM_000457 /TAXON_ID=3047 /ORGANISM="Dunaliella tertiolecta, Strain CCMP1320" /LENGTH=317 /DNA_ID=CAMNT_0048956411 /DNA_START=36 /DNA_END=989 /DNA_ORIENTATION=+
MEIYKYLFWALFLLSFVTYFVQHLICAYYYKTQNLKRRYNAKWALVTGASSGIGKSIAFKLARQGLNVVLVALGDPLLDATHDELVQTFDKQEFRKVPANLGGDDYLDSIKAATDDIPVQIVFCNAGYLLTGFFFARSLGELMANMNCNATSAVQITHHFVSKMVAAKLKGCFVYTSSAAASAPSPFSVLYAATKSFLASFGAGLAAELGPYGIDVLVFFPSPVASRFYDKAHKIDALEFFKKFAVSAEELPDTVFASIGRTVFRDVGPTGVGFRLAMKIIDYNFLAYLTASIASFMPDYKRQKVEADAALARNNAR